jgi:hypothetical protein
MFAFLTKLLLVARSRLKSRASLEAENLVLRQRVIVLSRKSQARARLRKAGQSPVWFQAQIEGLSSGRDFEPHRKPGKLWVFWPEMSPKGCFGTVCPSWATAPRVRIHSAPATGQVRTVRDKSTERSMGKTSLVRERGLGRGPVWRKNISSRRPRLAC